MKILPFNHVLSKSLWSIVFSSSGSKFLISPWYSIVIIASNFLALNRHVPKSIKQITTFSTGLKGTLFYRIHNWYTVNQISLSICQFWPQSFFEKSLVFDVKTFLHGDLSALRNLETQIFRRFSFLNFSFGSVFSVTHSTFMHGT